MGAETFDPAEDFGYVKALCEAYYVKYIAGGSLHIVLDDGNLEDDHIDFCIGHAARNGDLVGLALGALIRQMPPQQRELLYKTMGRT